MGCEVQWKKWDFHHDRPELFHSTQWTFDHQGNVGTLFVIYKVVLCVFALVNYIINVVMHEKPAYFLMYMTNQGITILSAEQLLSTVIVVYAKISSKQNALASSESLIQSNRRMPVFYRISWVLTTLTWTTAVFISIFYWSILFDPSELTYFNVFVHGLNSVMCLLDLAITARPFRFLHVFVPLLFGIYYVVFSVIYYFAGGTNENGDPWIYVVLDWSKPGPTIGVVVGAAVGLIVVHAVVFGLYKLKAWIWTLIYKKKGVDNESKESDQSMDSPNGQKTVTCGPGSFSNPAFTTSKDE